MSRGQLKEIRKLLFIFGTRPEAVKLCPVVNHLRSRGNAFDVKVCVTGQHREMLDQVLATFSVDPDYDLKVMQAGQTLGETTSRILAGLDPVLQAEKPDMVLVQGDTTSTFCGALAAFYSRVPIGHVEAGLRTGDMREPFPEEMNRVLTARLTALHFAATEGASANLQAEGVPAERIVVTGNTGIDAILYVKSKLESGELRAPELPVIPPERKLIAVTGHRRESFGGGLEQICRALSRLADRPDVQIVYPVHPNPNVQDPVQRLLAGKPNVLLTEPLDYVPFVDLMRKSLFLLTDSGGIQEEAPSLGKPVLVMRDKTERPEAVRAGTARLVGTDENAIVREATILLDDAVEYQQRSVVYNQYGDGHASERIAEFILRYRRAML